MHNKSSKQNVIIILLIILLIVSSAGGVIFVLVNTLNSNDGIGTLSASRLVLGVNFEQFEIDQTKNAGDKIGTISIVTNEGYSPIYKHQKYEEGTKIYKLVYSEKDGYNYVYYRDVAPGGEYLYNSLNGAESYYVYETATTGTPMYFQVIIEVEENPNFVPVDCLNIEVKDPNFVKVYGNLNEDGKVVYTYATSIANSAEYVLGDLYLDLYSNNIAQNSLFALKYTVISVEDNNLNYVLPISKIQPETSTDMEGYYMSYSDFMAIPQESIVTVLKSEYPQLDEDYYFFSNGLNKLEDKLASTSDRYTKAMFIHYALEVYYFSRGNVLDNTNIENNTPSDETTETP